LGSSTSGSSARASRAQRDPSGLDPCPRLRVVGVELGQLDGRVHRRSLLWWASDDATSDRAKAEWVVEAPAGSVVQVEARHQRAGLVRRELTLE
jgi:hypothetical protein